MTEALDVIVKKDPGFKVAIYQLAEQIMDGDVTEVDLRDRRILLVNRLFVFSYAEYGPYSVSYDIIVAHNEEEAKARAMESLKKQQTEIMKTGSKYLMEDWEDLEDVFGSIDLIDNMEQGIIEIGGYCE